MVFKTYILQSLKTDRYYTGSSEDLEVRVIRHDSCETKSTRSGIPWRVVYVEGSPTRELKGIYFSQNNNGLLASAALETKDSPAELTEVLILTSEF